MINHFLRLGDMSDIVRFHGIWLLWTIVIYYTIENSNWWQPNHQPDQLKKSHEISNQHPKQIHKSRPVPWNLLIYLLIYIIWLLYDWWSCPPCNVKSIDSSWFIIRLIYLLMFSSQPDLRCPWGPSRIPEMCSHTPSSAVSRHRYAVVERRLGTID